jgi:hypothetical protein
MTGGLVVASSNLVAPTIKTRGYGLSVAPLKFLVTRLVTSMEKSAPAYGGVYAGAMAAVGRKSIFLPPIRNI